MKYKILWADMHSNPHHEQIGDLDRWLDHARKNLDFWPVAYYPFYSCHLPNGLVLEETLDPEKMKEDWEKVRQLTEKANEEGFPMFMGYEWQGSGQDGDHNVFFLHNDGEMAMPLNYKDLVEHYRGQAVIGIPHHVAYQPGFRGKNWDTHDEQFSPFAEIYSSHGCSENDYGLLAMSRHSHMGPRTGETCGEQGLARGYKLGLIASGDNHLVPAVFAYGTMAALTTGNSKEEIWDALVNRRVYGVSHERIKMDLTVDGQPMGSVIKPQKNAELRLELECSNALDRVEIIKDNRVVAVVNHTSTWESRPLAKTVRFKFRLELGWGPNTSVFPDQHTRHWSGRLETGGKLLSIENVWSSYGQEVTHRDDHSGDFSLTTYQRSGKGHWMGSEDVTTEGFIFEIEDDLDSHIRLIIDGEEYEVMVREILNSGKLFARLDESAKLLRERFGFTGYYRTEPVWRHAYKIKVNQGVPEAAYRTLITRTIDTTDCHNLRIRVYQRNGSLAWSSPLFTEETANV